jgi:hypothetical protein
VSQGYVVLRFTNEDVLKNLEGVIATIHQTALPRLKRRPPSLALPHKGGGSMSGDLPLKGGGEPPTASGGGENERGGPRP